MAFVAEDGTGLENSNSYVSIADFTEYWTDRNIDYTSKTDIEIQASLIIATQYIDNNFNFIGYKLSNAQALKFPRYQAFTREGYFIEGIPEKIKYAVIEATKINIGGTDLFGTGEDGIKETTKSVGPISTSYKFLNTATGRVTYQAIKIYLKGLLRNTKTTVRRY